MSDVVVADIPTVVATVEALQGMEAVRFARGVIRLFQFLGIVDVSAIPRCCHR